MGIHKKIALKANVEIQRNPEGDESSVAFIIESPDGSSLTGQQILEAVAEATLLYWDNNPLEERDWSDFDA